MTHETEFIDYRELCELIRDELRGCGVSSIWVGQDAMSVEYNWAQANGLITKEQVDLAYQRYGWRQMHYAGC